MQQQLCPEMMDSPPMNRMPAPNQPPNAPDFMMEQHNMCNSMCSMGESDHLGGNDPNLNNCLTPSSMMSNPNSNSSQYSQCHSSVPPTSGPEWPKGNYLDDRRRKSQNCGQGGGLNNMCNAPNSVPISHPSPLSQPSSTLNSPNPCISQSPGSRIPPPPYNQGIRPLSSPHPSSPATGSLPMPSPRMQSPADPSRPQFSSGGQSRLPHTSPSPATPSADSNSSIPGTGVHSPKPMPASSQTSMPSSTSSSTVVQNNSRNQTSTNVTNMRATTPSTSAPLSSSPSNIKKLPNHMSHTSKGMSQDMASDLMNSLSSVDQKPHPNDMSLMGGPTLQNCSSPFMCKQEPALMPVPSPQQIQYLNSFEGQELTIQKQPNTSLRDSDLISPAPDLDLGFGPEFGNNCQSFGSSERLPNFAIMDNMNPRFGSNPSNANMSGHQFEPNPRFMASDNNQRFLGPMFDGPNPRIPNHENQFRAQNMLCMPYGQMDNNMMRFNTPCDNPMGPRLRPNHPNDMVSPRFPSHPNESIQSSHQFNSSTMSPMSSEQMNLMPFPTNQSSGTGCMSSVNNFNQQMESGVSSTHLQNLQKMTPPFDIGPPNKVDQMMMSNGGPLSHNNHNPNNQLIQGSNGSMGPSMGSQTQRNNNFDPISSMAAMSESNVNNHMNAQNMMSGSPMTMSGMQVAANGPNMPPGAPNLVNFHTQMNSMQGMHQNMTPEGNGMQSPYGMNPQMNPQMSGGPQTVNNTYVNATMSIQQLNIQNVSSPNFNPNLEQNMNIGSQPMSGPGMSPPSAAMQMMQNNSSGKMGPNFSHRMTGPTSGPNFSGQQMNSRGMNPMNFGGNPHNPHMMQRCSVYNSANIQIKPDAPNTIQYLPPRQQNPNMSNRPPSLDFLQRCEPPLTNLGNKLPTHNLQYFPSNNSNMNSPQSMPLGTRMMAHNMPLASGPGRPMNPSMVRGANPNALVSGQQQMMSGPDMFGRPPGPNNMNGPPNAMFANMKPSNSGPISPAGVPPDAAQPLPPSMSHSYNYKQSPFNAVPNDPNYAIQYQHFQQQLYATNTNRSSNTSNNNNSGNTPRMPANNFNNSYK